MELSNFTKGFSGVEVENKALRYGLLAALIANLFLAYKTMADKPAVVITPPNLTEEVKVWQNKADEGYKKLWGLFFAKMLGNVTPGEAGLLTKSMGVFFDPSIFNSVNSAMAAQLDAIELERVSLTFSPQTIKYERSTDTVFVTGYLESTGVSGDPKKSTRTYEMRIKVDDYRPRLTFIDTYDGIARTKDVKEKMAAMKEKK